MSTNEIRIGQYRFSKNLGTGTFGKVKMAFHEQTGHKVAIKILNKKKIRQYGVFEKVKRELKILRRFNNPHTIKLFEFIDTQSEIFMVLEYAAGGELFDLIARREKLSEADAKKIFQQIISSIEYSHHDKIAHRDLKPENLLLDDHNNIRLIDFGLANIMRDSLALKTACGSPNYAAPEVISGLSYGGAEVDIWSCGVILYAMVCGSLPFDDDHMPQLFSKIKECRYFIPQNLSPAVQDLINRMLQPNPVKRISLQEIQEHIWYQKDLPEYLHFINKQQINNKNNTIDNAIVNQLFQFNPNIGKSFEEVCRDILNKRNTDYCGAYELMRHDKLKQECFKGQNPKDPSGSNMALYNNYMMSARSNHSSQSKADANRKSGKLRSVQHIINTELSGPNNQSRVDYAHLMESGDNPRSMVPPRRKRRFISGTHLHRLNKIQQKFQRDNDYNVEITNPQYYSDRLVPINPGVESSADYKIQRFEDKDRMVLQRTAWLNFPRYAMSTRIVSPKNPFAQDRNNQIYLNSQVLQPGAFHVGLKFQGDAQEMLRLVCHALVKVEIEWQYDVKEMKLKCRTKVDDEKLVDDDRFIEDFIRQHFLKFYVYINKIAKNGQNAAPAKPPKKRGPPAAKDLTSSGSIKSGTSPSMKSGSTGEHHILNLYMQKGTMPVFLELADRFFSIIQQEINGQASSMNEEMMET